LFGNQVGLIIEVPSDFVILAQSPNGIQLEVHCVNGEINYAPELFQQDSYIMCQGESEEFDYSAAWTADKPQVGGERGYFAQFTSRAHELPARMNQESSRILSQKAAPSFRQPLFCGVLRVTWMLSSTTASGVGRRSEIRSYPKSSTHFPGI
jgi:hypothetical protein